MRSDSLFDALGGHDAVLRLAAAWHARVLADEVVAHAFSHGFHPEHVERLAAYWAEAWGGPAAYSGRLGSHAGILRSHSCNGPHEEMDRRAMACFDQALEDAGVADATLRRVLHDYFDWATQRFMAPPAGGAAAIRDDLPVPWWSWQGLVAA